MFARSFATTVRGVLPFAQWAAYAIQLGYVGYNLYQMYQTYLVQMEQDARNGTERPLDETIELIVKPRRRKAKPQPTTESSSLDNDDVENRENCPEPDPQLPSAIESSQNSDRTIKSEEKAENLTKEDEVTIVYDNRHDIAGPSRENTQQDIDETSSNGSTSLESTDSNRGILRDIYSECFICTRTLNDPRKPVATLPFCMHPFHQSCLDGVLKWHPKCPVCDYHIFCPI